MMIQRITQFLLAFCLLSSSVAFSLHTPSLATRRIRALRGGSIGKGTPPMEEIHQHKHDNASKGRSYCAPVCSHPKTSEGKTDAWAAVEAVRISTAKNTRLIVAGSAAIVLLWRRDALTISLLAGAILNAAWSKILKRILNEQRPEGAPVSDPGMPSSHAMSLFFFASYLSMASVFWSPPSLPAAARLAVCAFLYVFAINSASWRVSAGLHTRDQVLVGSIVGSADGLLWFWATCSRWDIIVSMEYALAHNNASGYAISLALICGAVVVGSLERRVSKWMSTLRELASRHSVK